MAWETVDADSVIASMSTALGAAYTNWLAEVPAKSGRLAVVVGQALAEWRDALGKEGAEALDPDEATVPKRVVHHVQTFCHYRIALEMNASGAAVNGVLGIESLEVPEGGTAVNVNNAGQRGELRRAYEDALAELRRLAAGRGMPGTPSYGAAAARAERVLS